MIAHSEKATPTTSNLTQQPVLISTASLHRKVALVTGGTPGWPAEKVERMVTGACLLRRCAVPEDIAQVVGFLAMEGGVWVNGEIITVSGEFK